MTARLSRPASAAAYLSDVWQENWQRCDDGRWSALPALSPASASWGIEPAPMFMTDAQLMEHATREGWQG